MIEIDADNVLHTGSRKDAVTAVKRHINAIWQRLEDEAAWPLDRLEALAADLERHLP